MRADLNTWGCELNLIIFICKAQLPSMLGSHDPDIICQFIGNAVSPNDTEHLGFLYTEIGILLNGLILI